MGSRPTQTLRGNHGCSFVPLESTPNPTPVPARTSMRPLPPRAPQVIIKRFHQQLEPAGGSNNNNNSNNRLLSAAVTEPPPLSRPPPSIRPLLNNNNGRSPATVKSCGDGEQSVIFDFGSNNSSEVVDWNSVEREILYTYLIFKVKDQFSSVQQTIEEFIKENLL